MFSLAFTRTYPHLEDTQPQVEMLVGRADFHFMIQYGIFSFVGNIQVPRHLVRWAFEIKTACMMGRWQMP